MCLLALRSAYLYAPVLIFLYFSDRPKENKWKDYGKDDSNDVD